MNEIDKAEYKQALRAFLIPSSLFVACLLGAAGVYMIREGEGFGWGFVAASFSIIIWAFVAFVTFQNKLRAQGLMKDQYDSPTPELKEEPLPTELPRTEKESAGSAALEPTHSELSTLGSN